MILLCENIQTIIFQGESFRRENKAFEVLGINKLSYRFHMRATNMRPAIAFARRARKPSAFKASSTVYLWILFCLLRADVSVSQDQEDSQGNFIYCQRL
jgi:hypothetical protein